MIERNLHKLMYGNDDNFTVDLENLRKIVFADGEKVNNEY